MPAFQSSLIRPLFVSPEAAGALIADAARLPRWTLLDDQVETLDLLTNGAMTPLRGFMSEAEFSAVQAGASAPWPRPVSLQVAPDFAARIRPGDDIALCQYHNEGPMAVAVMSVTDIWGDPIRLGGKVKGLRPLVDALPTPQTIRAELSSHRRATVLAVMAGDIGQGCPAASAMGAAMLVIGRPALKQPVPPRHAVILPLKVPDMTQVLLHIGMIARNYGATHLFLPEDAQVRASALSL